MIDTHTQTVGKRDKEAKLKYPKSWCKPIDEEKEILLERLQLVKERPFFDL